MQTPIQAISSFGAPTDSFGAAVTYFNHNHVGLNRSQHEKGIADIMGFDTQQIPGNDLTVKFLFLYCVQETIRAFNTGNIPDMDVVWKTAQVNHKAFIDESPWVVKDFRTEGNNDVDDNGTLAHKGSKKQQAEVLYLELNDGKNDRHVIVDALMNDVGLSKPGATTYFHNLKKTLGFAGPDVIIKQKQKKEQRTSSVTTHKAKKESKGSIAERVFLDMPGASKSEIVTRIVAEANTTPAGANTYYCAAKRNIA